MKKAFLIFTILGLFLVQPKNVNAQYYFFDGDYYDSPWLYEAGISVNAMNSLTDLGGKKGRGRSFMKDLNMANTNLSGGVFFNVTYKNAVALRLEGTYGKVSGSDQLIEGVTDIAAEVRYNRNLNFRSYITDINALLEIHPMYILIDWAARESAPPRTSPYLLGGIGYYSFNPQAKLGNNYIDLHPLKTEGQGFPETGRPEYSLNQLSIPLGMGLKYELSRLINVRLEFLYRKLFTDYLDDVSTTYIDPSLFSKYLTPQNATLALQLNNRQIQTIPSLIRGRPSNDSYFTANLKVSVVLGRKRINR